jgi:hypothetical protein
MTSKAPEFDEALWFTTKGHCNGKHYLLYNAHTFTGRMRAWCPHQQVGFYVSKSEIDTCSLEASYWIKGFLAGNEPDAPRSEDGDYLPDDHPALARWRAAILQFPETGYWNNTDRNCDNCGDLLLPSEPKNLCAKCRE